MTNDAIPRTPPPTPTLGEAFKYWLKLGFISFGGPAGQIAMMHQELVVDGGKNPRIVGG